MKTDQEIIESLTKKIQQENKEKSYLSPASTKRSTSIYPHYTHTHSNITKIANSDLSSKFNINGEKEILFGNEHIKYTIILQPPHMNIKNPSEGYEIRKNINNDDIVYIHDFIKASSELTDICNGLCTNPYGFGKVISNDYGDKMLVHFGIYDENNCMYLVPSYLLHFHARPSLITTEWFMSNDPDGFKIQEKINEPMFHSRSLFDSPKNNGPPREPFTNYSNEEMTSKPFPQIPDGYKTPDKGGFSKTIKNNKNIKNKTLKTGGKTHNKGYHGDKNKKNKDKNKKKNKDKKQQKKEKKNKEKKTIADSINTLALFEKASKKEITDDDKEKLFEKYKNDYKIYNYFNIKNKPLVIAEKDKDIFMLFLSDKEGIKLNK